MSVRSLIVLIFISSLSAISVAQEAETDAKAQTLDRIQVTGRLLRNAMDDLAQPVEVLQGDALSDAQQSTLGGTVAGLPGVHSSNFGAGVGRPIIRGMDGGRVQILNGGMDNMDLSTISADHAVSSEPFLADQIEVFKGPANLLFGSGAIGGAVNLIDGRIPTARADIPFSGRAELRSATGNNEINGLLRLDGGRQQIAWHADAFLRESSNYAIPGFALSQAERQEAIDEGEDPDHFAFGRMPKSDSTSKGAAAGASYIGDQLWFGLSIANYNTEYGIPPAAHDHGSGPGADEEENVRIDLQQTRFDTKGGVYGNSWVKELNWHLAQSDYQHTEFEGTEVGTRFFNDGKQFRLNLIHEPIRSWDGAIGLSWSEREILAIGDEAFIPPTRNQEYALIVMQERELAQNWKIELGARGDQVKIQQQLSGENLRFRPLSASLATMWHAADHLHFNFVLDYAERAPSAEELFSDGPHIATQSYEMGDSLLGLEKATRLELGVNYHNDPIDAEFSIYQTQFDDFIYLSDTGTIIDDLPALQWSAGNAKFFGWESKLTWTFAENATGEWALVAVADQVSAKLSNGEHLPRIPPQRLSSHLNWQRDSWRASLGASHYSSQSDTALNESRTPGYTLYNALLSYFWTGDHASGEIYLKGENLSDAEARVHTSFLKEISPLPGRTWLIGVRTYF